MTKKGRLQYCVKQDFLKSLMHLVASTGLVLATAELTSTSIRMRNCLEITVLSTLPKAVDVERTVQPPGHQDFRTNVRTPPAAED